ncbi:MAG: sugar phosphate isomerase/epimerase [Flavisolibacter sp.]
MRQRREFIKTISTGLAVVALSNPIFGRGYFRGLSSVHQNFGMQLYTLRDEMPKDPKGILKQIALDGYKEVEGFEGPKGIFWDMTPKEFKSYMDQLGMKFISSHCDINKNFEHKVEQAASIGMKYLIAPYLGPQKTMDDYKRAAEKFNEKGEVCKKAGLRFAYHNHDYSFIPVSGIFPQDILMQHSDTGLVDFEMDIYWVITAGQDPIKWMEKYPNRFRLGHIKDRKKNEPLSNKDASCTLGQGSIDWTRMLAAGKKHGMHHFIVEQERYDNTTPIKAAKDDAEFLKKLKV